jgi:two-component system, LytTR family, sensor kinase
MARMTTPHTGFRIPGVWLAGATLFASLMFVYNHLDEVARQTGTPFYFALIDEFTGVFGAAALFPLARWTARRFPVGRQTWMMNLPRHVGSLLLFSITHTTLNWTSREVIFRVLGLGDYDYGLMSVRYLMEFPIDVILYTLFVWGVWFFDRLAAEREAVLRAAQLESQLRQAQLQGLRLQLQPHFLFNALNTISATMYDDPEGADVMLSRLAELLRVSLRTTQTQEVPLAAELEVLDHYVALLQARFGDRLSLRIDVDPPDLRCVLVPSLILQPLVENAVRHGNLSRLGVGRIEIHARKVGDRLRVEVNDDGPGPAAGEDVMSKGIGIASTIERLTLLHGDAQRFEARTRSGAGFQVAFELPLRTAVPAVVSTTTGEQSPPADETRKSAAGALAYARVDRR